jgi:phage tail-like protein
MAVPQPGQEPIYHRAFQFHVEIGGISQARFQDVSGLDATTDMIEYREGGTGTALSVRKLPGLTKHSNLTLKRGYTDDDQLWKWYETMMLGKPVRKNVSVIQLDMTGQEKFRWTLYDALPVKYTGPTFNAKGNELSIETLEIAYQRIERS